MKTNTSETLGVMFDNKTSWKKMEPLPTASCSCAQVSGHFVLKYSDEEKKSISEKSLSKASRTQAFYQPLSNTDIKSDYIM